MTPVMHEEQPGVYQIRVDGIDVLEKSAETFQHAIEAWFGSFWIFALVYPPQLVNTLTFIERVLLKGPGKLPSAVVMWAKRLNINNVSSAEPGL